MTSPARTAAFHALRAIEDGRSDFPAALARSRRQLTDDRDRALTAAIAGGTLRWQRSLDHLIQHFARRPASSIDASVQTILRLSVYQLLHLDRVPASAVVDDAVNLTAQARTGSARGFVNAVLRNLLRQRHKLPLPTRPAGTEHRKAWLAYLGVALSHPDWLVERWIDRHGIDATERWLRFDNDTPPLTLRANRLRATREDVRAALENNAVLTAPTAFAPDGLVVTSGNPLRQPTPGLFFVQDEASQLVAEIVGARPGECVLDLCASPGGKTTALAAAMEDSGTLVACDVRARRIALLRDTVRASGASHTHIVQVGRTEGLPFNALFDRVLVDAPCSGLGTIRRDPEIRWRRTAADLPGLASGQRDLLARAAALVRPGGRLVYATCSSEPEENEEVVDAFLATHRGFSLVDLRAAGPPVAESLLDDRGCLRTLPFAHGLEAFFAAAMVFTGSSQ